MLFLLLVATLKFIRILLAIYISWLKEITNGYQNCIYEWEYFKKICMWYNLKVLNLKNLPIKYTIYKNLFMDLNKL
jgi:hypothetical protein